jgi:hypothetical protein
MALGISIKGHYAERRVLFIVLLHVIMLSVVMQNVILLRAVSPARPARIKHSSLFYTRPERPVEDKRSSLIANVQATKNKVF